jgi:hypothetical protein
MPDNGVYVAFGWLTRGQILSLPLIVAAWCCCAVAPCAGAAGGAGGAGERK